MTIDWRFLCYLNEICWNNCFDVTATLAKDHSCYFQTPKDFISSCLNDHNAYFDCLFFNQKQNKKLLWKFYLTVLLAVVGWCVLSVTTNVAFYTAFIKLTFISTHISAFNHVDTTNLEPLALCREKGGGYRGLLSSLLLSDSTPLNIVHFKTGTL